MSPFFAFLIPFAIGVVIFLILFLVQRRKLNKVSIDPVTLRRAQTSWSEPQELKYTSPPRPARIKKSAKIVLGLILALCVFLGVTMFNALRRAEQQQERAELLAATGVTDTASITRKWSESEGKSRRHLYAYSFLVGDKAYTGESSITGDEYRHHAVGDPVEVRYKPADPTINALLIEAPPPPLWLSVVFMLFPIFIFLVLPLSYRKYWQLMVSGQTAPGLVLLTTRGKNGYLVHYEFCDDRDRIVRGKGFINKGRLPEHGETVTVLFMKGDSKKNTIYPNAWIEIKSQRSGF